MFMKKSILTLLILSLSFYSYSQHKKLEIVCEVFEGHINYGQMQFFVPDSVKKSHLISIRKKSGLSDLGIINMLCLNGWSLAPRKRLVILPPMELSAPSFII